MAGTAGLLAETTHVSGVLHALALARPVGAVLVVVGTLLACRDRERVSHSATWPRCSRAESIADSG